MKNKVIIFFIISLIFLYGCSNNTGINNKSEIKQVKVIATCDDSNQCTDDRFNELTQECEHVKKTQCCGDKICDSDERCDISSYKTICPEDCVMECPAKIIIENWGCTGNCIIENDIFRINGDSFVTAKVKNIGELGANNVINSFKCYKENRNIFTSSTGATEKSGVSFRSYFTDMQQKVYLSGVPYRKDSTTFYLEINGIPQENLLLDCDITISDLGNIINSKIKIKLSQQ